MSDQARSRNDQERVALETLDENAALRAVLEGTATATGEDFLAALVRQLGTALGTDLCWVTEYRSRSRELCSLAFWMHGEIVPQELSYQIDETPCAPVVDNRELIHIPDNIIELYPGDNDLERFDAVSYLGAPLLDADGETVLGHLAVMDSRPMPEEPRGQALFRIFAARAAAELRRIRAEKSLREREEKMAGILNAALDAVLDLDEDLRVSGSNPAAARVFDCDPRSLEGRTLEDLFDEDGAARLRGLIEELADRPPGERSVWVPGDLSARTAKGTPFPAEASLSRFEAGGRRYHLLILRNVRERAEAERRIRTLSAEAEALRREIRSSREYDEILGESEAILRLLEDIDQVAGTDATVLVTGETGTGKELVARAIHRASRRAGGPLVCVNCAALPENLVESELFGHAAGAFTGATKKREGRFILADGGTLFLDEVGELPLDLQAKLLRAVQEGTFEPVGSSQTFQVDVRVVAATNRDLRAEVGAGRFREDLYFRLNVFPLEVPPLRARRSDVPLLAEHFAASFARSNGLPLEPLTGGQKARLAAYDWPGNVRELRNVMERGVIISRDGRLDLDRVLPASAAPSVPVAADGGVGGEPASATVLTDEQMRELERLNVERALEACDWKVSGEGGAAELLGLKPSTLSSRIKSLGIERPR